MLGKYIDFNVTKKQWKRKHHSLRDMAQHIGLSEVGPYLRGLWPMSLNIVVEGHG